MSSFPVPFSPWIRILASLAATASTSSKSSRIFLLLPMMFENEVLAADLLLQLLVLPPLVVQGERPLENRRDARRIEIGFFDEIEGAGLSGFERTLDGALTADDDHLGRGIDRLHLLEEIDAVGVRKQEVEQDDVRSPGREELFAACPMTRGAHLVALSHRRLLDDHLEPVGHHRLVVDDEHSVSLTSSRLVGIHSSSAHLGRDARIDAWPRS